MAFLLEMHNKPKRDMIFWNIEINRVTRQNTELRSVKTECGQFRFFFFFFFSFLHQELLPLLPSVWAELSPYALISDKFRFNILITTEKYYYIQHWMPAVQFLIDHVGRHGLFFVKLTNLHYFIRTQSTRR